MNDSVGSIILSQLGGNRFVAMTGAKNFVGHPQALSFKLPGGGGFTKDGINYVQITLEPGDTYYVEFYRTRKQARASWVNKTLIAAHAGIYADQLRDVFTRATGLATSLGTMGRA